MTTEISTKFNDELDSILGGTKFSHRTKALRMYANSGITPQLAHIIKVVGKTNVPISHQLPYALKVHNDIVNGVYMGDNMDIRFVNRWGELDDTKMKFCVSILEKMYLKVKPATLVAWYDAVMVITVWKGIK